MSEAFPGLWVVVLPGPPLPGPAGGEMELDV